MAKDRGGRNRQGKNHPGKNRRERRRAGGLRPDRRVDPAVPSVGLARDAPGGIALDARLRETVSTGPLSAAPLGVEPPDAPTAAALPVDLPPVPPPEAPDHAREALRLAMAAPVANRDGIAPGPAPAGQPAVAAIGVTLIAYVQDESLAALSHLHALGAARSPAEAIRLQLDEMRRAADATLTCWSRLARDAGRLMGPR